MRSRPAESRPRASSSAESLAGREHAVLPLIAAFDAAPSPCVATIGSFDGVHEGHRAVLAAAAEEAANLGVALTAVTFDPRPEVYFKPEDALPDLCATVDERVALLHEAGADHVCVLPFDGDTAALSDGDFVSLLTDRLGAVVLVVGADFRLGRDRRGDPERITELGLPTLAIPLVLDGTEKVSSTALRARRVSLTDGIHQ